MTDLDAKLLRQIRRIGKWPGSFVGAASVTAILAYLRGYLAAEYERVPGAKCSLLSEFHDWLISQPGMEGSQSIESAVERRDSSDRNGHELLREFDKFVRARIDPEGLQLTRLRPEVVGQLPLPAEPVVKLRTVTIFATPHPPWGLAVDVLLWLREVGEAIECDLCQHVARTQGEQLPTMKPGQLMICGGGGLSAKYLLYAAGFPPLANERGSTRAVLGMAADAVRLHRWKTIAMSPFGHATRYGDQDIDNVLDAFIGALLRQDVSAEVFLGDSTGVLFERVRAAALRFGETKVRSSDGGSSS